MHLHPTRCDVPVHMKFSMPHILHALFLFIMSTHQTSMHRHSISLSTITHKSPLNWDFNPTRHHSASTFKTRNKKKIKIKIFLQNWSSIATQVSPSRQRLLSLPGTCRVPRSSLARIIALRGQACRARGWTAVLMDRDLENLVST